MHLRVFSACVKSPLRHLDIRRVLCSSQDFLDDVRSQFRIGADQAPQGLEGCTRQVLTLHHAGADMRRHWPVADIGIPPGAKSLRIVIVEKSFRTKKKTSLVAVVTDMHQHPL